MATHGLIGSLRRAAARGASYATLGCVLTLVMVLVASCNLASPSSPNAPTDLTGQTPNQSFTFNGTIVLTIGAATLPADDSAGVIIQAEVFDADGRPVQNLTPVVFSTNLGTFSPGQPASTLVANTFSGIAQATLSSFQRQEGIATVLASIADVTAVGSIELTHVPIEGSLELNFRVAGQDLPEATGAASAAAPFRVLMVAEASGTTGQAIAGALVRFRITDDDSTGSGIGPARFEGSQTSFTNTAGEAFERLIVVGIGKIVLEADLIDPVDGTVVATSNQIFALTQVTVTQLAVRLTISDLVLTSFTGAPPYTTALNATVLSGAAGQPNQTVQFTIKSDTTGGATLVNPGTSVTNNQGLATNQLNVPSDGVVVVFAQAIGADGSILGTSNDVFARTSPATGGISVSLTFDDGTSVQNVATAPYTEGMIATVRDGTTPLVGRTVRFRIRTGTDTTTGATLQNTGTTLTNNIGEAVNAVNVPSVGSVVIFAEVLDAAGNVEATSNDIVATGE